MKTGKQFTMAINLKINWISILICNQLDSAFGRPSRIGAFFYQFSHAQSTSTRVSGRSDFFPYSSCQIRAPGRAIMNRKRFSINIPCLWKYLRHPEAITSLRRCDSDSADFFRLANQNYRPGDEFDENNDMQKSFRPVLRINFVWKHFSLGVSFFNIFAQEAFRLKSGEGKKGWNIILNGFPCLLLSVDSTFFCTVYDIVPALLGSGS